MEREGLGGRGGEAAAVWCAYHGVWMDGTVARIALANYAWACCESRYTWGRLCKALSAQHHHHCFEFNQILSVKNAKIQVKLVKKS